MMFHEIITRLIFFSETKISDSDIGEMKWILDVALITEFVKISILV